MSLPKCEPFFRTRARALKARSSSRDLENDSSSSRFIVVLSFGMKMWFVQNKWTSSSPARLLTKPGASDSSVGSKHGIPDVGHPPAGGLGLTDWGLVLRPLPGCVGQHLPLVRLAVPAGDAFRHPLGECWCCFHRTSALLVVKTHRYYLIDTYHTDIKTIVNYKSLT